MRLRRIARIRAAALAAVLAVFVVFSSCVPAPEISLEEREFADLDREIFLVNGLAETLSVLNPATLEMYDNVITVGKWPNDILHHEGRLYVTNSGDNNVAVYDESTFELLGEIYLGKNSNPWSVIVKTESDMACVPCFVSDEAVLVNLADMAVITRVGIGNCPEGGAYADGKFYVCDTNYTGGDPDFSAGSVSVIDSEDYSVATIELADGINPQSAIAFPDLHEVHVICTGVNGDDDGRVVVIDTASDTVVETLEIGGSPSGGAQGVDWANHIVYLTGEGGLLSYDYQTRTVLHGAGDPIETGKGASDYILGAAFDEVNDRLFVCNFSRDQIIVLDGSTYAVLDESPLQGSDGVQIPVLVVE